MPKRSSFVSKGYHFGNAKSPRRLQRARSAHAELLEPRRLLSSIYVDARATGATHDGRSWATAFQDLQLALGAAQSGDQIQVAEGTYKPTATTDRTISFQLKEGVSLFGGYAGDGAANPDARDITLYPTILSGDVGTPGDNTDNSYHVVTGASGITSTTRLDGFTITAGNAARYSPTETGGGIYLNGASPTVANCEFRGNSANAFGGGMYTDTSSPTLIDCTFSRNTAGGGGGMGSYASSPVLNRCTFSGNSATYEGGGICDSGSSPTLTNCIFTANSAASGGGAYNGASSPTLTNCTFIANSATDGGGGMLNVYSSSPTLTNCTLYANTANHGSAICNGDLESCGTYNGAPTLTNCIVWGGGNSPIYDYSGPIATLITYSDIQGGYAGAGNINADPLFVRNPSPGIDNTWATTDDDNGDLRLRLSSPAIDAGSNLASKLSSVSTDLEGQSRFVDIPGKGDTGAGTAPIADMGAYEAQLGAYASAGGPCLVRAGDSVTLAGAGGSSNGGAVTFSWDLDNDGIYDDASGPNPVFSASSYLSPTTLAIAVRVTDSAGQSATASTTLTVVSSGLYVDSTATGTGDGSSWGNAYVDLQAALAAARPGDRIWVAHGTYKPTTTADRDISFELKAGVTLLGGYAGYGAPNPDARDITLYPTILSGDIGVAGDNADNTYHVVTGASGITSTTVLDGFTVTAGNANGFYYPTGLGGGMYLDHASPTLANCVFTANAAGDGGGVYISQSLPVLASCTFAANAADRGAGIYVFSSSPVLTNCSIIANSASELGGGMLVYSSSPVLTNCAFIANSAASDGGGMYDMGACPAVLTNCTFVANSALGAGGAIYASSSGATATNCILWANRAPNGSQMYGYATVTYSDIQGGFTGTGNIDADPLFLRNPSAGGDGVWGTADDDYGDLRTHCMSPVVDAGSNAAPMLVGVSTDLGGNRRFVDILTTTDTGTGPAPVIDMGANEAQPMADAWITAATTARPNVSVPLSGYGSGSVAGTLQFAWDFDNDGIFDDATGANPSFVTTGLPTSIGLPISLRVTDAAGKIATASTTLTIVSTVLYVDESATGTGDGSSWANAFTDLQSALDAASPGCEIHVAAGTYKPTSTADRSISFQLPVEVAIYGGYVGDRALNPDARDVALYPTILSGDIGTPGDCTDNSYHVVTGTSGITSATVLDGFTITAGNANGTTLGATYGGGIHLSSASPTLSNCTFLRNNAVWDGGGLCLFASSPTLSHCSFIANSAECGGGIKSRNASSPVLADCTFTANTAVDGAGMYCLYSSATLTRCSFFANAATSTGGGFKSYASTHVLTNCTFVANSAFDGGGMYDLCSATAFSTLTNCTFTANSASVGGGMYGTGFYDDSVHSPVLTNCIAWGNTASINSQIPGTASITYSDIQGGSTGTGNIDADPRFVRNPSAGTDGAWGTADDDYGDLRPARTSPVIDAGINAAPQLSGITTDVAGNPRFVDVPSLPDTGVGTAPVVDMGSYEYQTQKDIELSNASVMEKRPAGTLVGTLSTVNTDPSSNFTYTLVDGTGSTDNASFTIDANQLKTARSFNWDSQTSCSIRVRATDQAGLSIEKVLTIGVGNANVAPTATVSLNAHSSYTDRVLTATATKADANGDPVTLQFVWKVNGIVRRTFTSSSALTDTFDLGGAGNGNVVTVEVTPSDPRTDGTAVSDRATLVICPTSTTLVSSKPSAEYRQAITFTATVTGAGGGILNGDVQFMIDGVNAGPACVAADGTRTYTTDTLSVGRHTISVVYPGNWDYLSSRCSLGQVVGKATLTITANPQCKTYGQANPAFTGTVTGLEGVSGVVVSYSTSASKASHPGFYAITPDVIVPADIQANYNIVLNSAVLTITKAIPTITWMPPAPINYGTALGAGQLNAVVTGVPGGTAVGVVTYTPAAGSVLAAGNQTLTLTVSPTTDYKKATCSVPLTVWPAHTMPTDIALNNVLVPEHRAGGFRVGRLGTVTPAPADTFTYSLVNGKLDNALFTIQGDKLVANASFNFATRSSYQVRVQSINQRGQAIRKTLTVAIEANIVPTDITLSNKRMAGPLPAGRAVGLLSTVDPQRGESFTYQLMGVGDSSLFSIAGNVLSAAKSITKAGSYVIRVKSTDASGAWVKKSFTITVG